MHEYYCQSGYQILYFARGGQILWDVWPNWTPRRLLYFVSRCNAKSSKCPKIGFFKDNFWQQQSSDSLWNWLIIQKYNLMWTTFTVDIFYDSNFSKLCFLKSMQVFVSSTCLSTKHNNFLGVCSLLAKLTKFDPHKVENQ